MEDTHQAYSQERTHELFTGFDRDVETGCTFFLHFKRRSSQISVVKERFVFSEGNETTEKHDKVPCHDLLLRLLLISTSKSDSKEAPRKIGLMI